MKIVSLPLRCLVFLLASASALLSQNQLRQNADGVVEMPVMKVVGVKPARFTIGSNTGRDGKMTLSIRPLPLKPDFLCVLVGGVRIGDEVMSINGKDVSALPRNKWSQELTGDFTLVIRRPSGRRSFELFEVEGRRDRS